MVLVGPQEHNPSSFSPGEDGAEQGCPHPATPGAIKHLVMEGGRDSKPPGNVTAFWCSLAKGSHDLQLHSSRFFCFFFLIGLWDFFPFPKRMKATKSTKGEVGGLQQHKADEK